MKKITFIILIVIVFLAVFFVYRRINNRPDNNQVVKNPFSLVKAYESQDFGFVIDSAFYGNNLLLVGPKGLKVLDITNPQKPVLVSEIVSTVSFNDIFVQDNYAYIVVGERKLPNGQLKIFDLSNLKKIVEVGKFVLPEGPISVFVQNNIAFVGDYASGAFLIDVSDPKQPKKLSNIVLGSDQFKTYDQVLASALSRFKVNTEKELFALARQQYPKETAGKSDADIREFIRKLGVVGHSWWMRPYGNILYLPYDGEGLYTVDISDPRNPKVLDNFNKRCFENNEYCFFNDVEVIGNYAFVAIDYGGLLVLDVSNPKSIKEVKQVLPWPRETWSKTVGHMIQIKTLNNYAFLTAGEDGFYVFDIENPANPVLLKKFSTDSNRQGKGCSWGLDMKGSLISIGYAPCVAHNKIVGALEIFKIIKN